MSLSKSRSGKSASAAAGSASARPDPFSGEITSSMVLNYITTSPNCELMTTKVEPEASYFLAQHVTYALKETLLRAKMFAQMSKRDFVTADDFKRALGGTWDNRDDNQVILVNSSAEVIDLSKLLTERGNLPKLSGIEKEPTLRVHWLAVDGVQPLTPENTFHPGESGQPATFVGCDSKKVDRGPTARGSVKGSAITNRGIVSVRNRLCDAGSSPGKYRTTIPATVVTHVISHQMSMEHQMLYLTITANLVGKEESTRKEILLILETDPGVGQLLPELSTWILEGIRINVAYAVMHNLTYILRGVNSLLANKYFSLMQYLHQIIPAVTSCLVSKHISDNPQLDHHWVVRDYAAKLLKTISGIYDNTNNHICVRLMRIFSEAMTDPEKSLVSVFGAISGVGEFGHSAIRAYLVPRVKTIAARVQGILDSRTSDSYDRLVAEKIRLNILKYVAPCILKDYRDCLPDIDECKTKFGELGASICTTLMKMDNDPSYQVIVYQPPPHILALVEALVGK